MDNERMDGLTLDIESADREKLRSVFPQCFTDGKLDIDLLLNLCGEYITDDFEKYEFRWKGKGEALQLAAKTTSPARLNVCAEKSSRVLPPPGLPNSSLMRSAKPPSAI